eukprot:scaffold18038_cov59-Cyclotella_meneghiniana.AAC.6
MDPPKYTIRDPPPRISSRQYVRRQTETPSAAARAACDGGSEVPTDTSAVGGSMGRKDDWRLMVCLVGRLSKAVVGHGVGVQK